MIYSSQFGSGVPLGATVQGIGLSEPEFLPRDDNPRLRSAYPRLSSLFPIGKITGTVRTLPVASGSPVIAASPTYFVTATGSTASTAAWQYSTDAASWTSATTPTFSPSAIEWCGNRFIALSQGAHNAIVTTGDAPNGTWTSTSVGPSSVAVSASVCRLIYSPTLGRTVAVVSATNAAVYSVDNGSTTWTPRTVGANQVRMGGCWTGNKFLLISPSSAVLDTSADATGGWTTITILEATSASQGNIASDGNGTVVVSGCPSGLQVSTDHGATWVFAHVTGIPVSDTWRVKYVGDRFIVPTAQGNLMSLNGKNWFLDKQVFQPFTATSSLAKKGTTFAQVSSATTVAYSYTESTTEFVVPSLKVYTTIPGGAQVLTDQLFIKAL